MVQGTTPTLLFKFSFDLALAKEWRIIFYQDEENNFPKTQNDCIVDENQVIYIKLTQEETLSFDTNKYLKIQAKALTNDNNVIPSDTITTHIHEILDKALFEIENTPPTIIDTSVIEFHFNEEHCQYGLDFEDLYIEQVGTGGGGTNGKDGVGIQSVVQTTTSTEDNGKNVITVTLTNGNKSTFVVENGSQGSQGLQGQKGADGYTPVKGKDYFTIEDVQNIVNQVIATLPIEQEVNDSTKPVSSKAVNNTFQNFSSSYMQMVMDLTVKKEFFNDNSVISTIHNTDYHATGDISNLDIRIPSGNILCSIMFKIIDSGNFNISILGANGYIGKAPDFKNGETWELNIHNGIIASGKVVSE